MPVSKPASGFDDPVVAEFFGSHRDTERRLAEIRKLNTHAPDWVNRAVESNEKAAAALAEARKPKRKRAPAKRGVRARPRPADALRAAIRQKGGR